jgi:hypothetical protein
LLQRQSFARVNLSRCSIDMSQPLGCKEVVKILGWFLKVMLQNVGDVFVNATEAGLCRSTLGVLVELIIEIDLMHDIHLPVSPNLYYAASRNLSPGIRRS